MFWQNLFLRTAFFLSISNCMLVSSAECLPRAIPGLPGTADCYLYETTTTTGEVSEQLQNSTVFTTQKDLGNTIRWTPIPTEPTLMSSTAIRTGRTEADPTIVEFEIATESETEASKSTTPSGHPTNINISTESTPSGPLITSTVNDFSTNPPQWSSSTGQSTSLSLETSTPLETSTQSATETVGSSPKHTTDQIESSTTQAPTTTSEQTTRVIFTSLSSTKSTASSPKPTTSTTQRFYTSTRAQIKPCPSRHWLHEDGICYYGIASRGWMKDQVRCRNLGANLVSIHNQTQNSYVKFVSSKSPRTPGKIDVSIGLKEVIINRIRQWKWVDGTPLNYENWSPDYNDTPAGELRCATFWTETKNPKKVGLWRYVRCEGIQAQAICMRLANCNDHSSSSEETDSSEEEVKRSRADRLKH